MEFVLKCADATLLSNTFPDLQGASLTARGLECINKLNKIIIQLLTVY